MRKPVHRAVVMEVSDGEDIGFMAMCLRTGRACDAYGYVNGDDTGREEEYQAIDRAVEYLGDRSLHDLPSEHFCDAEHVV